MSNILEVCCGSYYDALQAQAANAKRIELNTALSIGGITPSLSVLKKIKQNTTLEVVCMVRPRGAGFHYDALEKETMFADAKDLLDNGADGIVFGFLNADSTVDIETTSRMVELIHSYQKTAIFHRAIDVSADYAQAFAAIVEAKVDRVLTSGAKANAAEGAARIKSMVDIYGDQIEVLAGCGVNATNAAYIIERAGVIQIHASCKTLKKDPTTSRNSVNFSDYGHNEYIVCDAEEVKSILNEIA